MPSYPKDFSEYPQSVADFRSEKTQAAKDWNPRDVLLSALRDIDNGKINPDALMVVYRNRLPDGSTGTGFLSASPDGYTTCALFEYGKRVFFKAGPAAVAFTACAYSWAAASQEAISLLAAL